MRAVYCAHVCHVVCADVRIVLLYPMFAKNSFLSMLKVLVITVVRCVTCVDTVIIYIVYT